MLKIASSIFVLILTLDSVIGDVSWSIACESSALKLVCPKGSKLRVKSASYGRTDSSICQGGPVRNTNCFSETSLAAVQSKCESAPECVVYATNEVFTDPCVDTYKYLNVSYSCEPTEGTEVIACESTKLSLQCPPWTTISVEAAYYGRLDASICPFGPLDNIQCSSDSTKYIVKSRCDGQNTCDVEASDNLFGDPCYGTYKYLKVVYFCRDSGDDHEGLACESNSLSMRCPRGSVIRIKEASYGRTSETACPGQPVLSTSCSASTSFSIVQSRCNGTSSCVVPATDAVFGDPCKGTYKYLNTTYDCFVNEDLQAMACESAELTLKCPAGGLIRVNAVNYGRSDRSTCANGPIKTTNCYSANAKAIVENQCNGKGSCVVQATNSVFNDPCFNTYKFLDVNYSCLQP